MSEEKILFELRITEDGARTGIYESPEWQAYHAPRRGRGPGAGGARCSPFDWLREHRAASRPRKDDLRRALDSLEDIYGDLYGHSAESEV